MTVVVSRPAERATVGAHDRLFYSSMSIALALTVFTGFASTYYVPLVTGAPKATVSGGPFTSLVHLHAALFTAWVALFLVQTTLVAQRRVRVHRRLGVFGAVLALGMIGSGVGLAVATAVRGGAPPGIDPRAFLIVPLGDIALFTGFIAAALIRRRDKEAHKRLMLLAYVSVLAAATARLPGVLPFGPLVFFGLAFLFVVTGAIYDYATRGRVHRAYIWGGALLALSVPLRLALSGTAAWLAFADLLT